MPLNTAIDNQFALVDRTDDLVLLPQTWTLLGDMGLFQPDYLTTQVVTFEEQQGTLTLVKDQVRGSKPQTIGRDARKLHSYSTAHFPIYDALTPDELEGRTRPGSKGKELDTEAAALLRMMEKIRKSYDRTMEVARFHTITTGTKYAPNGTVAGNYYTDFGLTRNEVDFALGTATTDVIGKCEQIIAGFQASATEGQVITRVVGLASPAFFSKLISHAKVTQAFTYQQIGNNNITQERAGGMGLYRTFRFSNIDFIEVPVLTGSTLIPAGDCYFVAMDDMGSFKTFFSPAQRFGYVNTIAEANYLWIQRAQNLKEISVEAESNFLNVLMKPNFVARGHTA
jgi:hypothetical protein